MSRDLVRCFNNNSYGDEMAEGDLSSYLLFLQLFVEFNWPYVTARGCI